MPPGSSITPPDVFHLDPVQAFPILPKASLSPIVSELSASIAVGSACVWSSPNLDFPILIVTVPFLCQVSALFRGMIEYEL